MNKTYNHVEGSAEVMIDVVSAILEVTNGMTIVDLMACQGMLMSHIPCNCHIYVDLVKHEIRHFEEEKDLFVQMDAIEYLQQMTFRANAITCLDGIEHLSKEDGFRLLRLMKKKADHQIIFTPLGDFVVEPDTTNPDGHKSGWTPFELEIHGWATIVFPHFHKVHDTGAFFAYYHKDIFNQSARVINALNKKSWSR